MDLQEGEVAVPIEGFPEYFITNRGRVWSTYSNRWLKPYLHYSYYYCVGLNKEGKSYKRQIHRLVGLHFLPIVTDQGALICHKNEELPYPEINYLENLFVGNHRDNVLDREEKGRGLRGRKASAETKKRMSDSHKGKVRSAEHRRKLSESNKGKIRSPETRRKIGESSKGRYVSPETRRKISESVKDSKKRAREAREES